MTDCEDCRDCVEQPGSVSLRSVIEGMEDQIKMTDSNDALGLDLFCYIECNKNSPDIVKQCRGLVFHEDTLVLKGFPFTTDYTSNDDLEAVVGDFSNISVFDAYEGTLLRAFYFGGKWFLSTHRKLDAFRSKWTSRDSFGELFTRALSNHDINDFMFPDLEGDILERFLNSLDKNKQYMFLLRSTFENRIVSDPPSSPPYIYHVGTFVEGKLSFDEQVGLPHPERKNFSSLSELTEYVNNIDPKVLPGVILFRDGEVLCKIVNPSYMEMFNIRGNEPSVRYRYLQLRMKPDMVQTISSMYPEFENDFNEYEKIIVEIGKYIHGAYVDRFIFKKHVVVPQEEFSVIRACHSWHLSDREKNKVTLQVVIDKLNEGLPSNINHMIRRYKEKIKEKK